MSTGIVLICLWLLTSNDDSVPTDIHVFKGLPHGFRRYGDQLTESKRWDKVMEEGITWALSNPEARNFEVKST